MSCDVCIPWRPTPERAPIFDVVRAWWTRHGFRVILGDSGHATFNRAASRNVAVALAHTDEVIVADADTLPDIDAMHRAVELSREAMVYPFDRYLSMSLSQMYMPDPSRGSPQWIKRNAPGGIFAIRRSDYRRLGGQDVGFTEWGFEDDAFALVARDLHKVIRLRADVYAFEHGATRDWSERNPGHARLEAYRAAARRGELESLLLTLQPDLRQEVPLP